MNIELDRIYNMDCLEGMKAIPDGSVDAVICDLPYGTVKGMAIEGWKNKGDTCQWDEQLPTDDLMAQYTRVLRQNGVAILFSQEPYTHELRAYGDSGFRFVYPLIWIKNNFANAFSSDTAPVSYFEDMSVFRKIYDMSNQNPLRDYSLKVLQYIGRPRREIINDIGQCVDHFFRHSSSQFAIPTSETYQALIDKYGIDKMEGFKRYDELEQSGITFNLPEGQNIKSNVFQYTKDTDGIHPTQKPLNLIRDLVLTYTNEGDTVLDNCMGSGTTAIACIKERRHFIGFELNKEYFDKACKRIDMERRQLTLF